MEIGVPFLGITQPDGDRVIINTAYIQTVQTYHGPLDNARSTIFVGFGSRAPVIMFEATEDVDWILERFLIAHL